MDGQMNGCMYGWTDEWRGGWMTYGWIHGWMDGWMDGRTNGCDTMKSQDPAISRQESCHEPPQISSNPTASSLEHRDS